MELGIKLTILYAKRNSILIKTAIIHVVNRIVYQPVPVVLQRDGCFILKAFKSYISDIFMMFMP